MTLPFSLSLPLSLCSIKTIQRLSLSPRPLSADLLDRGEGEKIKNAWIWHGWTIGLLADVNWAGLIVVRKRAG